MEQVCTQVSHPTKLAWLLIDDTCVEQDYLLATSKSTGVQSQRWWGHFQVATIIRHGGNDTWPWEQSGSGDKQEFPISLWDL